MIKIPILETTCQIRIVFLIVVVFGAAILILSPVYWYPFISKDGPKGKAKDGEPSQSLHYTKKFHKSAHKDKPLSQKKIRNIRKMLTHIGTSGRKLSRRVSLTPQAEAILDLWSQGKEGGVYVEVGAFDGETSSNTLALEVYYNWTGLLIEADKDYYTQLVAKHRTARTLHGCISPSNQSQQMYFREEGGQIGSLVKKLSKSDKSTNIQQMLCQPLGEILLSFNMTHINYLSLDVEGSEFDVLESFPYDKVTVDYISAENLHVRQGKEAFREMMKTHGYKTHAELHKIDTCRDTFVHDFLFVKDNL